MLLQPREEPLQDVSRGLGNQRLGSRIEGALRRHLRAAIRRRTIQPHGPLVVCGGADAVTDYELNELWEVPRAGMRKGTSYEGEDVIHALDG